MTVADDGDTLKMSKSPLVWRKRLEEDHARLRIQRLNLDAFVLLQDEIDDEGRERLVMARRRLEQDAERFQRSLEAYVFQHGPFRLSDF